MAQKFEEERYEGRISGPGRCKLVERQATQHGLEIIEIVDELRQYREKVGGIGTTANERSRANRAHRPHRERANIKRAAAPEMIAPKIVWRSGG